MEMTSTARWSGLYITMARSVSHAGLWTRTRSIAWCANMRVSSALRAGYSAHSMRATFITTALENGAQLEYVQKAAGHCDPSTAKLYDRRGYNPDEWREKNPGLFVDLSEANLSHADLDHANLALANLSGADLTLANLSQAILIDANLSEANLSEANLIGARLNEADLLGAKLSKAILKPVIDQQVLEMLPELLFRLVARLRERPEMLHSLDATAFWAAVRKIKPRASRIEDLRFVNAQLSSEPAPGALWTAWMKNTRATELTALLQHPDMTEAS
jgi:uncharacterized protein YjbI with pentapeptide repeats